ncbi:MAG TPA: DUF2961 domain-containing protein [Rhodanobacteraceae bacterium]|nr:DUF2961 domain-containing protein [Rhodanobacteraceae bacterium]
MARGFPSLVFLLASALAHANGLPWEIWESPGRLALLDAGDVVLERSSRCSDGCRYDRSNRGSEDPLDNPYPERWLYRDGVEDVVFDDRGPGAVTRIWLTTGDGVSRCIDPAIRVRFYVDGAALPIELPLAALFDGSTPPFTAPLVGDRLDHSGGYVSHVPIAYAQSLRIALVNADNGPNPCTGNDQRLLWFQMQYHHLVPGTAISGFTLQQDFPAWRELLEHAGDDPWNGLLAPWTGSATLAPGATLDLADRAGPGWLRGIRLALPRSAWAAVRLRVLIDGASAVDLPLADFFASGGALDPASVPARGVLVGEDAGGWLYAWFPMPFVLEAKVQLVADSGLHGSVQVTSDLRFDPAPVPPAVGRFAARIEDACTVQDAITLYSDDGAGKLVGLAARYSAASGGGFLEGDERATIDGAFAPAWYGTGVEDFYNGGFYFDQGTYARGLSGATLVDTGAAASAAMYRLLLTDALPYTSRLRLTREAGPSPTDPATFCVRAVAYAYRDARALVVPYDHFEVGDAVAAGAHDYALPAGARCGLVDSSFEDQPPTRRRAMVCRYSDGSSRFRFHLDRAVTPLRLRRILDVGLGEPGSIAGAPAAAIRVNGVAVGAFPPVAANPVRRWQQQEALLSIANPVGDLGFEIVPQGPVAAAEFSESAWQLRGGWVDALFANGFEWHYTRSGPG